MEGRSSESPRFAQTGSVFRLNVLFSRDKGFLFSVKKKQNESIQVNRVTGKAVHATWTGDRHDGDVRHNTNGPTINNNSDGKMQQTIRKKGG